MAPHGAASRRLGQLALPFPAPMSNSTDAPLMLTVSGMRGIVGASFTPEVATNYAKCFAGWLAATRAAAIGETSDASAPATATAPAPAPAPSLDRSKLRRSLVCIARDGRRGGEVFLEVVRTALLDSGCDVIDLDIAMTPTVGVAIGHHHADGALVVTASHNPQQWNGIKALDADGLAPAPERAAELIARFRALTEATTAKPTDREATASESAAGAVASDPASGTHTATHSSTGKSSTVTRGSLRQDAEAAMRHVERVLKLVDVDAIRRANVKVALDSVNASGCVGGRALLERLGCEITHINGEPTGVFTHAPEPLEINLGELMSATSKAGAACGFAQDPDADRLAIIDERGQSIGEECTLALAAWRMLERCGAGVMATNLSTSRLIDSIAARFPGSRVIRTAVGEANVSGALKREHGLIGGEGNGGVIVPSICWIRDSLSAMALVLDLLVARGQSISGIVAEMPRTVMLKAKLDLAGIGGAAAVAPALERVRAAWSKERVNTIDGVRVDLDDGWVHLRASNTEPIIRIIAEAETVERAEALITECCAHAGIG